MENYGTEVEQDLTDKFKSLVWKVVSRDKFDSCRFDSSVSLSEIVEMEVKGFKEGLASKELEYYKEILSESSVSSVFKQAEVVDLSSDKEDGHDKGDREVDFEVFNISPSPLEAGTLMGAQSYLQPGPARASDLETLRQQDEWRQWSAEELRRNVSELERQEAVMRGFRGTEQPQQLPDVTSPPPDISKEELFRILHEVQSKDGSGVLGESELRS